MEEFRSLEVLRSLEECRIGSFEKFSEDCKRIGSLRPCLHGEEEESEVAAMPPWRRRIRSLRPCLHGEEESEVAAMPPWRTRRIRRFDLT